MVMQLDRELEELKEFIAEEEQAYYPLNTQAAVAKQQIQDCRREAAAQGLFELPAAVKVKREAYLKFCDALSIGALTRPAHCGISASLRGCHACCVKQGTLTKWWHKQTRRS